LNGRSLGFGAALVQRAPALGRRNYRLFITAQSVSLIGTWMQTLGQAWLIVVLTRDPFVLGMVTVAQALPVLIFSLIGGVIADRGNKRRILTITPCISGSLALILAVLCLTGTVQIWHVGVLAFLLGTVNAVEIPVRQSFVVEMVGPELVPSAVGLNSASYNGGRLLGPSVAGVLIGATTVLMGGAVPGTGVAFLVNAASFVGVVIAYLSMRESELQPVVRPVTARGPAAVVHQISEGIDHVRHDRPVLMSLAIPGLIAMIAINFGVLIPVLVLEYGLDSGGLGLLMAANGIGALAAALRVGMGGKANPEAMILGGLVLGGSLVLAGLIAAVRGPLVFAAVLLFAGGVGSTMMRMASNTSLQLATPPEVRGRVMSLFALTFEGISPMGAAISGILAAQLGGPAAFVVCGSLAGVLILLGAPELRRLRLDRAGPHADEPAVAALASPARPGGVASPAGDRQ
jgi:MFS family permease